MTASTKRQAPAVPVAQGGSVHSAAPFTMKRVGNTGADGNPDNDIYEVCSAKGRLLFTGRGADARLFRSAPELLEALEACLPFIDDAGDIAQFYPDSAATDKCRAAVAAARAALAKAGAA